MFEYRYDLELYCKTICFTQLILRPVSGTDRFQPASSGAIENCIQS